MNNLFLMHTQYNLILSIGLLTKMSENTANDLILYAEFRVSPELEKILNNIFTRVLYIRKEFNDLEHGVDAERVLYNQVTTCKKFLGITYDNVYISQDRKLEIILLEYIKKNNVNCRVSSVEEDAYFTLERQSLHLKQKLKEIVKRHLQNLVHLILYHHRTNYDIYACYGMNPLISQLYVLFPAAVREEFENKIIKECTEDMVSVGINVLYGETVNSKKTGLVIASDLIERYRNKETVMALYSQLAEWCERKGIEFYIKYHPREINKLRTGSMIQELPTSVAIEKIYLDFDRNKTVVLGNMSTSVLTAKKLGFRTISIIKMNDPQQNILNAYSRIGIYMPNTEAELLRCIDDCFG